VGRLQISDHPRDKKKKKMTRSGGWLMTKGRYARQQKEMILRSHGIILYT
jgi:hypothetical protein